MSSDSNPNPAPENPVPPAPSASRRRSYRRALIAGAALVAVLTIGIGIGGLVTHRTYSSLAGTQALLNPVQIGAMKDWSVVAIKGQVAEIFGNKFILQDGSGRALVETGRAGEDGKLVAKDEAVTVAGRFEHGFVRAEIIVKSDGKTVELGPAGGPPGPGPFGWLRHFHAGAEGPGLLAPPAT